MSAVRPGIAIAVLASLGALTPLIAHAAGAACWIYLPAHVPALLAGLALGPVAGLAAGAATASADLLWGGRTHGMQFLPLGFEFVAYGVSAGLLSRRARSNGHRLAALVGAMLIGRLVHLAATVALGTPAMHVLRGLFFIPWPGMLLQLPLLPIAASWVRAIVWPDTNAPQQVVGVRSF